METTQLITWGVLLVILTLIATGRFRMEIVAISGLMLLGIAGIAPPGIIFSGFGHPALVTIITVFFISQGIIDSGLMRGLGQALARRSRSIRSQIIRIAAVGSLLSAFMNNVGAVGLLMPTVVRMAGRCGISSGSFGLPLAIASILGGAATLIGSAPNIIIASYMFTATGHHFKMFDYAPHGLTMLVTALLFWLFCKSCGIDPGAMDNCTAQQMREPEGNNKQAALNESFQFTPLATTERRITFFAIMTAVLLASFGLLHPAFGFGGAALVLVIFGVLKLPAAYECIDIKIVFFLGAMLGIGRVLEHTGALELISMFLARFTGDFSPFWLIWLLISISSGLSNAINNAAAAVFMAPLAIGIAAGSSMETTAALMAVAAGSNLTLLLPTHQATLMVLSKAPFPTVSFMRFGTVLTIFCSLSAAAVITLVWQ